MCSQPSGVERRETVRQGLTARRRRRRLVGRTRDVGQEFARPRRGHPPVEVGDQVSGPVRHGGFRPPATAPAPRRPAGAGPLVQSEPALGEPVVRTGRSRREPTAAPFGCRRSGATAPARRRRRGTRPAGGTTPPSPRGGDQGQLREQGQKVLAFRPSRKQPGPGANRAHPAGVRSGLLRRCLAFPVAGRRPEPLALPAGRQRGVTSLAGHTGGA